MNLVTPDHLFDYELERRVLARLFYRSSAPVMLPFGRIAVDDFYYPDHRALIQAAWDSRNAGDPWMGDLRVPPELADLHADIMAREQALDTDPGDRREDLRLLYEMANRRLLFTNAMDLARDAADPATSLSAAVVRAERKALDAAKAVADRKKRAI